MIKSWNFQRLLHLATGMGGSVPNETFINHLGKKDLWKTIRNAAKLHATRLIFCGS